MSVSASQIEFRTLEHALTQVSQSFYLPIEWQSLLGLAAAARGAHFLARRQETGKLRHIQEIAMADGREAMPKRGLINGSFSLFA